MTKSSGHLSGQKLGDLSFELYRFPGLQARLDELAKSGLTALSERKRTEKIHQLLLKMIQEVPPPCFLLAAVNEFIAGVNERGYLEGYAFSKFELWLNTFSGLSSEDNYFVRAKVMGRYIPRESYQSLFPIGMGKKFSGSHYVTAHSSPDLDTTVASFWGWADAFAARVGEGLHLWNVPGGPPESQVEVEFLFQGFLGKKCFEHFAKTRSSLALSAVDLLTKNSLVLRSVEESFQAVDYEGKDVSVVLVDEEGNYLSDWRRSDVESLRKVSTLVHSCIRWFASYFLRRLAALFSSPVVTKAQVSDWVSQVFSLRLEEVELVKGFTEKQKQQMQACLIKIFHLKEGWKATFSHFWEAMGALSIPSFSVFHRLVIDLPSSSLFDPQGHLKEDRSAIFTYLEKIAVSLEEAIQALRMHFDRLGTALSLKKEVFRHPSPVVSSRAEVEEIRSKMDSFGYITVTTTDALGNQFPLGTISSSEIFKPILGTVSLRDFCNREETKIPPYFEVISVVDHHKSALTTHAAATVCIADAQSANALVAQLSFDINDLYGTSGTCAQEVQAELAAFQSQSFSPSRARVLKRLLQKQLILERKEPYFVDPSREYVEYLHYLYAILDDTDLLSKVSYRDVVCVASLINRLKTLQLRKETEVISLDDLPKDGTFASAAAQRILQNEEMYSLYQKIYALKEIAIEKNLTQCIQGETSNIFADTKVQNGCCRVGQTKLFAKNFPFYASHAGKIRWIWQAEAKAFYHERKDCDLHMHMISTVPGAEDVCSAEKKGHPHQDELWIWIPMQEEAIAHLKTFLSAFRASPALASHPMEVEFLGENKKEMERIFEESFASFKKKATEKEEDSSLSIAILRYKAGLLNSRKAMISPYLPKLTG